MTGAALLLLLLGAAHTPPVKIAPHVQASVALLDDGDGVILQLEVTQ